MSEYIKLDDDVVGKDNIIDIESIPISPLALSESSWSRTSKGKEGMLNNLSPMSGCEGNQATAHYLRQHGSQLRRRNDKILNNLDLELALKVDIERMDSMRERRDLTPVSTSTTFDESLTDEDENENLYNQSNTHTYSKGLTTDEALSRLLLHGKNELPHKVTSPWYLFLSQLYQPMPMMIWCALLIEALLYNWIDMGILLFIQLANACIGYNEVSKTSDAISSLKNSFKRQCAVKRDGKYITIDSTLLVPGDLILLFPGECIPADCVINRGEIEINQSTLTGESLPVQVYEGNTVCMGSIVYQGETEATVISTGVDTLYGKTASLLNIEVQYSNLQKLMINIVLVLVVLSTCLCLIVFIYLRQFTSMHNALSFVVVLMVSSIPMAIEIVTVASLSLGARDILDKENVIVKRLSSIIDLAEMSILCSDKTGTLTLNEMVIQNEVNIFKEGITKESLLIYAAMACNWQIGCNKDALDTLVLNSVNMQELKHYQMLQYLPFNHVNKRTQGTVQDLSNGKVFKSTKGAPHVILKLLSKNSTDLIIAVEQCVHALAYRGIRCLAIAKTNEYDEWEFLGLLTFLDPVRNDSKDAVQHVNELGIKIKMITGDHLLIAKEVSRQLNIGPFITTVDQLPTLSELYTSTSTSSFKESHEIISSSILTKYRDICLASDGFAQVNTQHKYIIVKLLRTLGCKVGYIGDGINDTPALKISNVGIAVYNATPSAIAASDIYITQPGLKSLYLIIQTSRKIFTRIKNYFIYRISATLQLLSFFFIAVFLFKPSDYQPSDYMNNKSFPDKYEWPVYFHIPVLFLMLITLFNDGTLIAIGYDNVNPINTPEKWNLKQMFTIACSLSLVSLLSSLLLLYLLLISWSNDPWNIFHALEISGLAYGEITTSIYLKISISDFLTLFSARTGSDFFWHTDKCPAAILRFAAIFALTCSSLVALFYPASSPDEINTQGFYYRTPLLLLAIWIYCLVFWFIQDAFKVLVCKVMTHYNTFGVNNTTKMVLPQTTIKYIRENRNLMGVQNMSQSA